MPASRYHAVLDNRRLDKNSRHAVVARLSADFNIPAPTAAMMLSAAQVVVKRDLPVHVARAYQRKLADIGAHCRLVRADGNEGHGTARQTVPEQMKCPSCGQVQPLVRECRTCGLIIAKFRPRQAETAPGSASVIKAPDAPKDPVGDETDRPSPLSALRHHSHRLLKWLYSQKSKGARWHRQLQDALLRLIVLLVLAPAGCLMSLFMGKILWWLYTHTPVGSYYLARFGDQAATIQQILDSDPIMLTAQVCAAALVTGLAVGAAAQLLHLRRILYDSRGSLGKMIMWGLPMTALVAIGLQARLDLASLPAAAVLALLPILLLMGGCFGLVQRIVPEIGTLIGIGRLLIAEKAGLDLDKIRRLVRGQIDKINAS